VSIFRTSRNSASGTNGMNSALKYGGIFALVFALIVLCAILAIGIPIYLNARQSWIVFSASTSPDGSFVAENSMRGDEDAIDRISVRRLNGPTVYEVIFPGTMPSIFLKWLDSSRLVVLSDSQSPLPKTARIENKGNIDVSYSNYDRPGAAQASISAKNHVVLTPNASDIIAKIDEQSHFDPLSKLCTLSLSAKDAKVYDSISMNISVGESRCGPELEGKMCGYVRSHFSVGQRLHETANRLLTSATVSEIASYNMLPDGIGYHAIRGQFLGQRAPLLMGELEKESFNIDYNFDFDQENIRYVISTSTIAAALSEFRRCVGPDVHYY